MQVPGVWSNSPIAILGIYSMSGLSEFVEVHIFFLFSKVNFKMKKIYTI